MNEEELICRYCKRKLTDIQYLGEAAVSIVIGQCVSCNSEQCWHTNGKPLQWSFKVGDKYMIRYWYMGRLLTIEDVSNPRPKSVFRQMMKEPPDYLTPTSMTENRIKTFIVFQ